MIWVCCIQVKEMQEMQQAFPKVITPCYPLLPLERLHKKNCGRYTIDDRIFCVEMFSGSALGNSFTFIHVETESIIL